MEKNIEKITFTFADGKKLDLTGEALRRYQVMLLMHSDYLLPGDENMILGELYGGLVKGFMPGAYNG